MKLSGQSQAELIKIGAMLIGAGLLAWGGMRLYRGASESFSNALDSLKTTVTGAVDSVISAPAKAVEAVKETARSGGAAWQAGYADKTPPGAPTVPTSPYEGRYSNPMVNDAGMDFSLF